MSSGGRTMTEEDKQRVVAQYRDLRRQCGVMEQRIVQIEQDRSEHQMVVRTLAAMAPDRKCHRVVGGAMVERTVGEVLPVLQESLEQFEELLSRFRSSFEDKERELLAFKLKYNIRVQGEDDVPAGSGSDVVRAVPAASASAAQPTGVLVN